MASIKNNFSSSQETYSDVFDLDQFNQLDQKDYTEQEISEQIKAEQDLEEKLDQIHQYIITPENKLSRLRKTISWVMFLSILTTPFLGFLMLMLSFELLGVNHKSSSSPAWVFLYIFYVLVLAFSCFSIVTKFVIKNFKESCVSKEDVENRQNKIKNILTKIRSPSLRGKLSEVYFLTSHKGIDLGFWSFLNKQFDVFEEKIVVSITEEQIKIERKKYRQYLEENSGGPK